MRRWLRRPPAPPNSRQTAAYAFAGAIFVAGAFVLAWPWLSGTVTIPYDAKAHFFPQFAFLAHALHGGQSPFWTPNVFDGSPQIADPQSLIFAPAFLLAASLVAEPDFILADAIVFASLATGGLALILFFRDRAWHPAGAVVAALAFAFGGSAAWRIQHIGEVMSLAWFPLALFALSRALRRNSAMWGAAAGLFVAFLAIGRDQVALLALYLLAAYALMEGARLGLLRSLRPLAVGCAIAFAVASLPILLTIAFAEQSNRPEIGLQDALKGSLHPGSLLTLVSANLFGAAGPLADFWGPPSPAWGETGLYIARNMGTLYMGAVPVVAFAALLLTRPSEFWRDTDACFFAVGTLALGLFALGQYTPLFALAHHLPGIDLFRRPADATFLFCACLAILGGYAVHRCIEGRPPLLGLLASLVGALALCAIVAFTKDRIHQALPPLAFSLVFLATSATLLCFACRAPAVLATLTIGALLTFDLATGNAPNESSGLPPAQFDMLRADTKNETIALLRDRLRAAATPDRRDRIELAGLGFAWPNASLVQNLDHDLGYNPLRTALFQQFSGASDHLALPEQRTFSKAFPSYRSPAADLTGLRFIATGIPVNEIDPSLHENDLIFLARTADAYVYENPRALPRALLATKAIRTDLAALLRTGDWPAVDYARTVLLDAPDDPERIRRPGRAELVRYRNTEIVVDAQAPDGGWLVINDVWHPWWRATVDGAPTPILQANGPFRAVALPPGRHNVRLTFHPVAGMIEQFGSELRRRFAASAR